MAKVVQNATQLNRHDWEAQIMYFSFDGRFYNGNKDNDAPLHRADIGPKQNFQGRRYCGITQK